MESRESYPQSGSSSDSEYETEWPLAQTIIRDFSTVTNTNDNNEDDVYGNITYSIVNPVVSRRISDLKLEKTVHTKKIEEPVMDILVIEELLDKMDDLSEKVINYDEIVGLLEDFLDTLAPGSDDTLHYRALRHFEKAKAVWGNLRFIEVLRKLSYLVPLKRYMLESRLKLSEFLMSKIRRDPCFEDIKEFQDGTTVMRNALSILIGYWSNDDMLSLLYSVGGSSIKNALKGEDDSSEFSANKEVVSHSRIADLLEELSIKELANQLILIPAAVELVEQFMIPLLGDVPVENNYLYLYHVNHFKAAIKFWFNPLIIMELINALKKSEPLVRIFRKCTKRAQVFRCVERMIRIQKDPMLDHILASDGVQKLRGSLCILFGYWNDRDLCELFRVLCVAKCSIKEGDVVQVLEYMTDGIGDVKGLKNVLANKYFEDSDIYNNLLIKISRLQLNEHFKMFNKKLFEMKLTVGIDLEESQAVHIKHLLHAELCDLKSLRKLMDDIIWDKWEDAKDDMDKFEKVEEQIDGRALVTVLLKNDRLRMCEVCSFF